MESKENRLGAFLVNSFGDRYLYSVNRNAFNATGSDSLYATMFGEKLFAEYQLNIVIGTDSGIFPDYIARRGIPNGSRFIFVELAEVLEKLSENNLHENLPPEIRVVTHESWLEEAKKFRLNDYVFLDSVVLHESVAANDAHLPEYRDLSWKLNLELKETVHHFLTSINCRLFIVRQFENLAENRVALADSLVGAGKGKTAVVLAGGPSLRDALPWVRKNRKRLVIIAASRISRILLEEGIVPHIITSVDPQRISFDVSREMLRFSSEETGSPVFVHSYHATPLLVGQWQGKSVYTGNLFPWPTPLNQAVLPVSGPTVSNYALSVAMIMGCSPIILAGVDLCYTPTGQTHADGSNENKVGPDLSQISPRLETYDGGHADTNQGYAQSLSVLATQARLALNLGCRVFNCSPGAAKVPFIDYRPLSDFDLPEDDSPISDIIARRVPEPSSRERLTHYHRVKTELERARRKFGEILRLSEEALKCNQGLFGRNGMKRDFRHKLKMDKIERRLDGTLRDFSTLVKQFGIKKFLAILKSPGNADEWTDEQIEQAATDYYTAYLDGTRELIDIIDDALQRVDARIEEEKDSPDIAGLFARWNKDGQPGRALMWHSRTPGIGGRLKQSEQENLRQMENEFQRIMSEEQTSQMELLDKLHDVGRTRSKALLLYKRGKLDELESMSLGLSRHPDREKALPYLTFINGLIAELRGKPEVALTCYQELFGNPSQLLMEDALLQTASLAISSRDIDNALLAVECLAGISPAYFSPYGDLLKAVGRYEDAFNIYNRYLGMAPNDISVMLKLGIICKEAGIDEKAAELFRRVLEIDGKNHAAQSLLAELHATSQSSFPA